MERNTGEGVAYGDGFVGAIIKIYMNEWKSGCKKGSINPNVSHVLVNPVGK